MRREEMRREEKRRGEMRCVRHDEARYRMVWVKIKGRETL